MNNKDVQAAVQAAISGAGDEEKKTPLDWVTDKKDKIFIKELAMALSKSPLTSVGKSNAVTILDKNFLTDKFGGRKTITNMITFANKELERELKSIRKNFK